MSNVSISYGNTLKGSWVFLSYWEDWLCKGRVTLASKSRNNGRWDMASLISNDEINRAINNTPIFAGVGIPEQHLIASHSVLVQANPEDVIIKQGDIGDHLYIILKGQVQVSHRTQSNLMVNLNILGPGDVFGEIAILRNIPRTAFVTAITPCTFLTIDAQNFLQIYHYFSATSRDNIQLIIEKRLQQQRIY